MAEANVEKRMTRSLNHFAILSFTEGFWGGDTNRRKAIGADFSSGMRDVAQAMYAYRIFPARSEADILLWSAIAADDLNSTHKFFDDFARCLGGFRQFVTPVNTLWGFTRPSDYASGRSAQEIDPFDAQRRPYLVIYPFSKTIEWYLMSRDARQGMMNEHIRIGREFPDITQLLLYSTGLQDQEFVVAYETEDLPRFSGLVTALRDTEARRYTLRDTPIYTATRANLETLFQ